MCAVDVYHRGYYDDKLDQKKKRGDLKSPLFVLHFPSDPVGQHPKHTTIFFDRFHHFFPPLVKEITLKRLLHTQQQTPI